MGATIICAVDARDTGSAPTLHAGDTGYAADGSFDFPGGIGTVETHLDIVARGAKLGHHGGIHRGRDIHCRDKARPARRQGAHGEEQAAPAAEGIAQRHHYWARKLEAQLQALLPEGKTPKEPLAIVANYLAGAWLNMLKWWLDNRMPYPPERMDEFVQALVMPTVRAALGIENNP